MNKLTFSLYLVLLSFFSCTDTTSGNDPNPEKPETPAHAIADSLHSFEHTGLVLAETEDDSSNYGRLLFAEDKAFVMNFRGEIFYANEPFEVWEELETPEIDGKFYSFAYIDSMLYLGSDFPAQIFRSFLSDSLEWKEITPDIGRKLNGANAFGRDSVGYLFVNFVRGTSDDVTDNVFRMNLETLEWEAYGAGDLDNAYQGVVEFYTAPDGDLYFTTFGNGIYMREAGEADWKRLTYGYDFSQFSTKGKGYEGTPRKALRGVMRRGDSLFTSSLFGGVYGSSDKYFERQFVFDSAINTERRKYTLPMDIYTFIMHKDHFFLAGGRGNNGPFMYSGQLKEWVPLGNSVSCGVPKEFNNDCGGDIAQLAVYKDTLYALANRALLKMPLSDTVFWVDSASNHLDQYNLNYVFLDTIYPGANYPTNSWPIGVYEANPELESRRVPMSVME